MTNEQMLTKYKTQVVSAVIGALLSGVVSLTVGLFSLTKTFEITQTKERRGTLHHELALLNKVERELDTNLNLLLTQSMQPIVLAELIKIEAPQNIADPNVRAVINEMMKGFNRDLYRITESYIPRKRFLVTAWPFGVIPKEISFDLSEDIHDLYMALDRINKVIWDVKYALTTSGQGLGTAEMQRIRENCDNIKNDTIEISRDRILDLKNRVGAEKQRLEEILQSLPR